MQDISDCLSVEAQNVAEARLAAKRAARAEAREIRMKELERQQKEVEERPDKDFGEKDSLAEVEEKYKRSMVTNAQLDNEKTSLQYQVDTLREVLLELEEELAESRRQYEEKHKECERQKHDQNVLRFQLAEMKEALEQKESLLIALERQKEFFEPVRSERDTLREEVTRLRDELKKHGIALDSVGTPNGDASLEPPVNADGRPDPPIRATSMGPSEEAVEKKETMSVVGNIAPSKADQANQEVLLTAKSEPPQKAQVGDEIKEQNIQEIARISNDDADTCGTLSDCQTNLEHQGQSLDSESTSNVNEITVDKCAPENINKKVLVQDVSEVHREETMEQRSTSPVEIELFQDALDNVVQSSVNSQLTEGQSVLLGDFGSIGQNISQQDFNKDEGRHEVQSTSTQSNSVPNNGTLEIFSCTENSAVSTDDINDLHTGPKDGHETSSPDNSSQDDSEESTTDEITTAAGHKNVCEMVKPEQHSATVKLELESREDDSENNDSYTSYTSSEEESLTADATIHTDIRDVAKEKKADLTPEPLSQDTQLTKEEKHLVVGENNNVGEVKKPCIFNNRQDTVENEALRDSENFKESISHEDQHQDTTDAGILNLDSPENGKTSTVFLDAPGTELLNTKEQDTFSDSPVCALGTELLDEGKQAETSDHSDKSENINDNIPVVAETPKETILNETLSSEGESTPEGEESDENNDHEDMAVRSEKYTGESLPLGSSVDQISTDDIRMEDSSDNASRRGKGKNKEDCVVS